MDFLVLMKNCKLIITDSGGIQEEATAPCIRKHVLVIRLSTERPEAVKEGFAEVIGVKKEEIIEGIRRTLEHPKPLSTCSPYGDGKAAERIARIIREEIVLCAL